MKKSPEIVHLFKDKFSLVMVLSDIDNSYKSVDI